MTQTINCVNEFSELKDFFSNLHMVFKLVFILPVGFVPCEHSLFAMHRLKSWSMSGERSCGLALLYIY